MKPFRVLLDLDGTITQDPKFFATLTHWMREAWDIHVVTHRPEEQHDETVADLAKLGITYHHLALTPNKLEYALNNKINIVFEDVDHYFRYMPENVTVFKIREKDNWHWPSRRWIYDDKCGIHIEDLP